MLDAYYLTKAKWKYRNEKDGFAFGDFTKQQGIEYIAGENAYEARQYWKAWKELLKFQFRKNDVYGTRHKIRWFLCMLAMLINRNQRGKKIKKSWEAWQILCIWSESTYGGWSGYFLEFHEQSFTYNIFSDGDCSL